MNMRAADVDTDDEVTTDTPTDDKPSMDDTIREKYREMSAELVDAELEEEASAPAAPEAKAPVTTEQKRDAKTGQFQKGKAPAKVAADAVPTPPGTTTQPANAVTTPPAATTPPATAKPHDTYPHTWKPEHQAHWAALPEPIRQEIHRRENDVKHGITQYRDAARFGAELATELTPFAQDMRQLGVTPSAVLKAALPIWKVLNRGNDSEKAAALLQLSRDFGIRLDTVGALAKQPAPSAPSPELARVTQRQDEIDQRLKAQESEREATQRREDEDTVRRFCDDPAHPHAKAVHKEMAALLTSGQAETLDDAYTKAVWLNPEIRALLVKEQREQEEAKAAEEAAAARQASAANVPRKGTRPVREKPGTIEDTARKTYREIIGRS